MIPLPKENKPLHYAYDDMKFDWEVLKRYLIGNS